MPIIACVTIDPSVALDSFGKDSAVTFSFFASIVDVIDVAEDSLVTAVESFETKFAFNVPAF